MNSQPLNFRPLVPIEDRDTGVNEASTCIPAPPRLPIGGFFELETPSVQNRFHEHAIALSTGRSCLLAILKYLQPTRCYVPHYTCDAALAPFRQQNIELLFYELTDELQPKIRPSLKANECFMLTNYFGLQRETSARFSADYGIQLIVDDTHDFFSRGQYPRSWSFTSARKYFGVPDGAFLYPPVGITEDQLIPAATLPFSAISLEHLILRQAGHQQTAFAHYQAYERSLPGSLMRISDYSRAILGTLDMHSIALRRQANFQLLANQLNDRNQFKIKFPVGATPFAYPFLPAETISRRHFHQRQIFVPALWHDVLQRGEVTCAMAIQLSDELLPFPVDHRYDNVQMQRIIETTMELRAQS